MFDSEFHLSRKQTLSAIRRGIENRPPVLWWGWHAFPADEALQIIRQCRQSEALMAASVLDALKKMEEGASLYDFCDPALVPDYEYPILSGPPSIQGRAAALEDLALLLVTLDPYPFVGQITPENGRRPSAFIKSETVTWLNHHLHLWVADLQRLWRKLPAPARPDSRILNASLPKPMKSDATLSVIFATVYHTLGPRAQPSPHVNRQAADFARRFSEKLWPQRADVEPLPLSACPLHDISTAFQVWYFEVARNAMQHPGETLRSRENIFNTLRDHFNAQIRQCPRPCTGTCLTTMPALPEQKFTEQCVRILSRLRSRRCEPE